MSQQVPQASQVRQVKEAEAEEEAEEEEEQLDEQAEQEVDEGRRLMMTTMEKEMMMGHYYLQTVE